jgi:hypothetical protein
MEPGGGDPVLYLHEERLLDAPLLSLRYLPHLDLDPGGG